MIGEVVMVDAACCGVLGRARACVEKKEVDRRVRRCIDSF